MDAKHDTQAKRAASAGGAEKPAGNPKTGNRQSGKPQEADRQSKGDPAAGAADNDGSVDSIIEEFRAVAGDLAASGQARAARRISELSEALKGCSREFGDDEVGRLLAAAVGRASGGMENLGRSLERRTPAELLDEAERFLGRHPAATSATALALGFFAARFVRSGWPAPGETGSPDTGGGGADRATQAQSPVEPAAEPTGKSGGDKSGDKNDA